MSRFSEIPFLIYAHGRLVSQDLANSFLEYSAMAEHVTFHSRLTVCELGAGSGRVGYWLLRRHPGLRYVVVDIPPALDLAQWYLTRCYPEVPPGGSGRRAILRHTWTISPLPNLSSCCLIRPLSCQRLGGSVCEHLVTSRNARRAD